MEDKYKKGNELIAKFMKNKHNGLDIDHNHFDPVILRTHGKYHNSFDWSIPVVIELRKQYGSNINLESCFTPTTNISDTKEIIWYEIVTLLDSDDDIL